MHEHVSFTVFRLQLEQFWSVLNDELEMYRNMDTFVGQHSLALETAAELLSQPPDDQHIKEQAANVNSKFMQ